jgi:hypothetical protein
VREASVINAQVVEPDKIRCNLRINLTESAEPAALFCSIFWPFGQKSSPPHLLSCKLPPRSHQNPRPKQINLRSTPMKRCPECTFLYEDDQDRCDWDGTDLRFTNFLPPIVPPQPIPKVRPQSIWGGFTIPLLVIVLVATVLVTLYRAAPPTFSSSSGLKEKRLPGTNQDADTPASNASPQLVTAPEIPPEPAEPSTVQPTPPQIKARNRPVPPTNSGVTAAPVTHVQMEPATPVVSPTKPATGQTSTAPPASQKPAASSYSIPVHPEPPPVSPAPQSKTQTQEKDSKFKSLLKKAGRVLKKPF